MNILHLSRSLLANAPVHISNFLNKYGKDIGLKNRCITTKNGKLKQKQDICWEWDKGKGVHKIIEDMDQLRDLTNWCDILHIHNQPPFQNGGEAWEFAKTVKKPVVVQIHSEPEKVRGMYNSIKNHFTISKTICIAQYQTIFLEIPHETVRNVVDINDPLLKPDFTMLDKPYITYAPSNYSSLDQLRKKRHSTWAYKSTAEVTPVLKKLDKEEKISYKIFHEVGYRKMLEKRQKGNIHIDDIYTGSYHLSSLEGLSQGAVVICNLKPWMTHFLRDFLSCDSLPWIRADKKSLEGIIKELISDGNIQELQKNSREWMEKYWSSELVLNDYMKIYNSL